MNTDIGALQQVLRTLCEVYRPGEGQLRQFGSRYKGDREVKL